jgi:hypothetical protein
MRISSIIAESENFLNATALRQLKNTKCKQLVETLAQIKASSTMSLN